MSTTRPRSLTHTLGYAVGVGLAFLPLVGIPFRFILQELPPVFVYLGSFLLGAAAGALGATLRGVRKLGA
jgi:hypothetical protein